VAELVRELDVGFTGFRHRAILPDHAGVIAMRAVWSYVARTGCSNSAAASASMDFWRWLGIRRPRHRRPRRSPARISRGRGAWSGVSPASDSL
jgi:hypothetical protein